MSTEYCKIQSLFKRDTYNIIIPSQFSIPEFEWLKDCKFEATEKIDGCLHYSTRIQMADGSVKPIKDIKKGELVIGYDTETKEVKTVKVQEVAKQSAAGTWVKVRVTHRDLNKGNSFETVVCTFDHKVWTTNGYVEAYKLKPGDKVLSVRNDLENQYHKLIVEQEVIGVERLSSSHERWDIQTETHNFFTTTCLVHNTNIRIELTVGGLVEDKRVFSVEYKGRTDKANMPTHLSEKLHKIFDNVDWNSIFPNAEEDSTIVLYGEGYGKKIQSGANYIKDDVNFILFDIKVGKWWLNRESCEDIAAKCNINIVPIMGYMTIPDAIEFVKKGFKSTIAENKDYDAEGLVLKPPYGLSRRTGERIILKIKTCDFNKFKAKYGDNESSIQEVNPKYKDKNETMD